MEDVRGKMRIPTLGKQGRGFADFRDWRVTWPGSVQ